MEGLSPPYEGGGLQGRSWVRGDDDNHPSWPLGGVRMEPDRRNDQPELVLLLSWLS